MVHYLAPLHMEEGQREIAFCGYNHVQRDISSLGELIQRSFLEEQPSLWTGFETHTCLQSDKNITD